MGNLTFWILVGIVAMLVSGVRKPTDDNSDQWDLF